MLQEYDRLAHCFCLQWTSGGSLERKRNALAAADAQGDDPAPQSVAAQRVDKAGRQNRASGTTEDEWLSLASERDSARDGTQRATVREFSRGSMQTEATATAKPETRES
jgi:hypothetical protein